VGATGLPGRSLRLSRRPKATAEREFACLRAVAVELERLGAKLLAKPTKKKKGAAAVLRQGRGKAKEPQFKVGDAVEFDVDGSGNKWVDCEVLKVHPIAAQQVGTAAAGTSGSGGGGFAKGHLFDVEPREAWVGRQLKCPEAFLRPKGGGKSDAKEGDGVWAFAGLTDSEDEDWKRDSSDDDEGGDAGPGQSKRGVGGDGDDGPSKLPFAWFDRLPAVLAAAGWDDAICVAVLRKLAAVSGVQPFGSMDRLASAVAAQVDAHFHGEVTALRAAKGKADGQAGPEQELLNLLGAPRKSRLHSLAKAMARVENLGHVLAWTDRRSNGSGYEYAAALDCPALSLVELPRLKLAFQGRLDADGATRLYSLDHSDLFVTNDRHPLVNKMLQGIPHSLLLSNLRGELQVLVPVLAPARPPVGSQPFTTTLVLDRSDAAWAASLSSRYYMYPVHVSTSFLLTKGLNAALYLLLLRLLHRDYDDAYRLADSVATDTAFSDEGLGIFRALANAGDDAHPDAHAVREKLPREGLKACSAKSYQQGRTRNEPR
jgi:hypothetical protein